MNTELRTFRLSETDCCACAKDGKMRTYYVKKISFADPEYFIPTLVVISALPC